MAYRFTICAAAWCSMVFAGHAATMDMQDEQEAPSTETVLSLMDQVQEAATMSGEADALFRNACSQCHDTERATSQQKSYEGWLLTVRRMAAKTGANIKVSEIEPIAGYLASLDATEEAPVQEQSIPTVSDVLAASSVSLHATVSVLWRHGDEQVENEGFFPDVWAGVDWNPDDSPFSAQIMACTTCHTDGSGSMNIELVEGSFRADLLHLMSGENASERGSDVQLEAKAGRFAVPFGAYSGMAHPGIYRTLTNPLMYNMGRRVGYYEPVLPMPYADEGVNLHFGLPLPESFLLQLDGYAVNGLQEFGFTPSRSWSDNNSNAALGGRASLGSRWISIGGSIATGELQATGTPEKNYTLSGLDATLRYRDWIRAYYEYARREEDTTPTLESVFSGQVAEVEGMLWRNPGITLLIRYDTVRNPSAYGGATIDRYTWGPNIALPGGSLLIINHEHWMHEAPLDDEDVIGVRWIASF